MARLTKSSYTKIVLVCALCLIVCGTLTGAFGALRIAIYSWISPYDESQEWTPQANDETGSFTIEAESVHDISINWLAGSLSIVVVPDSETNGAIAVTETFNNTGIPLRWRSNGDKLEIDYGSIRSMIGCSSLSQGSKELVISIPESHASKLGRISLNSASGQYSLSGFSCEILDIKQASGNMQASDCTVGNLSVSLASGSFDFAGSVTDMIDFDQASGRTFIRFEAANPAKADISIASGDMKLELPSPDFQVELEKASGSFNCQYDLIMQGDVYYGTSSALIQPTSTAKIKLEMLSGNCEILKRTE